MENQHQKIKGYRDFNQSELDLINEAKELAVQVGEFVSKLQNDTNIDQRWLSIGKTQLQQGFMATIRSIAQPTTF